MNHARTPSPCCKFGFAFQLTLTFNAQENAERSEGGRGGKEAAHVFVALQIIARLDQLHVQFVQVRIPQRPLRLDQQLIGPQSRKFHNFVLRQKLMAAKQG
jgi:hypothetical protein